MNRHTALLGAKIERHLLCVVFRDEVGSADASHSTGMKHIKLRGYVNSECDWGDQDTMPNIEKMLHINRHPKSLFLNSCEERQ